jgi:hypothetical protein
MAENVNMDSFIRDTLRSIQRPRDVDFYSEQQPLVSTSTKNFTVTSITDEPVIASAEGGLLPPQAQEHQWQATNASATALSVTGGVFRSQGAFDQADVPDVVLYVGDSGYVILTVIRDIDSREVVAVPTISYVEGDPSESNYYNQIIPLAKVTFEEGAITNILQLKFEELHVFEDLAVVNGELRFVDLLMAGRNIYQLPA